MKKLFSQRAPKAIGPYSQGIEANGVCWFSGQIALNEETGEFVNSSFEKETIQVFENIRYLLEDNQLSFQDVVKVNISITDMGNFSQLNEIYGKYFSEPYPARACVAVKSLPRNGAVEIEVVAVRKGNCCC